MKNNHSIDNLYELVFNIAKYQKADIVKKGLKLCEESGELAAEILKKVEYKYTEDSIETIRENLLDEAVDCLIMVFDILSSESYTIEEIINSSDKKTGEWIDKIKKRDPSIIIN